jgi:translation initiation factor IF-2
MGWWGEVLGHHDAVADDGHVQEPPRGRDAARGREGRAAVGRGHAPVGDPGGDDVALAVPRWDRGRGGLHGGGRAGGGHRVRACAQGPRRPAARPARARRRWSRRRSRRGPGRAGAAATPRLRRRRRRGAAAVPPAPRPGGPRGAPAERTRQAPAGPGRARSGTRSTGAHLEEGSRLRPSAGGRGAGRRPPRRAPARAAGGRRGAWAGCQAGAPAGRPARRRPARPRPPRPARDVRPPGRWPSTGHERLRPRARPPARRRRAPPRDHRRGGRWPRRSRWPRSLPGRVPRARGEPGRCSRDGATRVRAGAVSDRRLQRAGRARTVPAALGLVTLRPSWAGPRSPGPGSRGARPCPRPARLGGPGRTGGSRGPR